MTGATIPATFENVFWMPPIVPTYSGDGAISPGMAQMPGDAAIVAANAKDRIASTAHWEESASVKAMLPPSASPKHSGSSRARVTDLPARINLSVHSPEIS